MRENDRHVNILLTNITYLWTLKSNRNRFDKLLFFNDKDHATLPVKEVIHFCNYCWIWEIMPYIHETETKLTTIIFVGYFFLITFNKLSNRIQENINRKRNKKKRVLYFNKNSNLYLAYNKEK